MLGPDIAKETRTAFVYVSLGTRVSPTLSSFAEQAVSRVEDSSAYLITNHPQLWDGFSGTVITYKLEQANDVVRHMRKHYPEKVILNNGFWMATLERLFALQTLSDYVEPECEVVHFESDVMSFLTRPQLDILRDRYRKPAVPLESQGAGCASIIYSPSLVALVEGLRDMAEILESHRGWLTDMQLLARAVEAQVFEELPTIPQQALAIEVGKPSESKKESYRLMFDATALGMYLFGADPVHTSGRVKPGFIQEDYPLAVSEFQWSVENIPASKFTGLTVRPHDGERVFVANLHIHSKVNPEQLSASSSTWQSFVGAANNQDWDGEDWGPPGDSSLCTATTQGLRLPQRAKIAFAKVRRTIFFERGAIKKGFRKAIQKW